MKPNLQHHTDPGMASKLSFNIDILFLLHSKSAKTPLPGLERYGIVQGERVYEILFLRRTD